MCDPFYIKYVKDLVSIYYNCYAAIFICFMTKAVHLDAVTDLASEAMIATLKIFQQERKSSSICVVNTTNFVGASAELKCLGNIIKNTPDAWLIT